MGAMTVALTDVAAALASAGVSTVIKQYSNAAPPEVEHAILTVTAGGLERADVDNYDGAVSVTIDWYYPGSAGDGQTEYLAAMDAYDAIVVALAGSLDRTCTGIDPSEGFEKLEESADLAHWYNGTVIAAFIRKEPAST